MPPTKHGNLQFTISLHYGEFMITLNRASVRFLYLNKLSNQRKSLSGFHFDHVTLSNDCTDHYSNLSIPNGPIFLPKSRIKIYRLAIFILLLHIQTQRQQM